MLCLFLIINCLTTAICQQAESISILHTNDIHAHLVPFDCSTYGNNIGGLSRIANAIRQTKERQNNVLVLDAGDVFQGTPFYNIFKGEAGFKALKIAGYNATVLGNHELDDGLANLITQLEASGIRLLCSNVFYKDTKKEVFQPFMIFNRSGIKVAVIGAIGDQAWESIDVKIRAPMYSTPKIETVKTTAQRLRPHVDLIIALTHSGYEYDKKLAKEVAEVDLIIGGHSHTKLRTPQLVLNSNTSSDYDNGLGGTIVAQAGRHSVFLGQVNIFFNPDRQIQRFSGRVKTMTSAYDPLKPTKVCNLIENYSLKLNEIMQQTAGYIEYDLYYPAEKRSTHFLPMGNFIAAAMNYQGNSDFTIVNSGGIRNPINAGKITWHDIYRAVPYDNSVVTFEMKGKEVQKMFNYISTHKQANRGYQIWGASAVLKPDKSIATNIKINSLKLDPDKTYKVSTSSFVANGNLGGDKLFANIISVKDSGVFMRDAVINYLANTQKLPDFDKSFIKTN